ncbi:MAG: hypothetical protein M1338_04740 [Patescibacteria group bacterium]|nr:hypothetical protein [Patescibacteria group bacterium]
MAKSTVQSTQEYIDIAGIKEGVMILKSGGLRMILMASSINFALKSEEEQNAIIANYQSFLNSLAFPIQIVMQSRRLDLDSYVAKLNEAGEQETNELIQLQIQDYTGFIKRLVSVANIMDKKFFIVIPYSPPNIQKRGLFDRIFNPTKISKVNISDNEFKRFKEELNQRASVITNGLSAIGVKAAILNTQQIAELMYSTYNPEEGDKEKLTEIQELEKPIV